ncbi:MAG TPA: dihydroorotase [Acidobacteriota bacterium]|nr:dihydroorotase [Acidobacteriota bacterium]
MQLILRQGRIVDPSQKLNKVMDIGVAEGRIAEIAPRIAAKARREIDARGLLIFPGFIDMHVHLREPGREDAETIETGTNAAARGGFTGVACMPNTQPVNDSESVTSFILKKARDVSKIAVYPIGAITRGSKGKDLAEIGEMRRAGIVAISDDGYGVEDGQVLRRAMEYSTRFNLPVIDHCEDRNLAAGGVMHEGFYSTRLGLKGINPAAEEVHVARDIILARQTGARVHIAHLSTRRSLDIVARARKEGNLSLTCEVTPHHLLLTDAEVCAYDTNMKMNPPLRSQDDVDALVRGMASGDIDVIATDHAPHCVHDKALEFDRALFGIVGLETAVSLICDRFVNKGKLSLERLAQLFSANPARILNLERGTLAKGAIADITVLDPERDHEVRSAEFYSRSRNTPFEGWKLQGGPAMTIVRGRVVWSV